MDFDPNLTPYKRKIMLALDVDSREKAEEWVHKLKSHVGFFKVGLQLFTKEGPELVRSIRARGGRIFLDVKYHDIPNTVAKACESAAGLGVDFINVHALGGKAMMKAAAEAVATTSARMRLPKPALLAVTVLTSHDARSLKREVGLRGGPDGEVKRLALLAKAAGCDGVVCSPREIALVRKACGPNFLIVTPGVRPAGGAKHDQKRTLTAGQALAAGADYLVVGRPVTEAADPVEAVLALAGDMQASTRAARKTPKKRGKA
ncbi:MAG TPA: orotidine-5'-phosphate decarboxylase [bacterium]|jgi:orotidine-5'-phosphate decarboxylase|nr:orotidine-5'-phosphate decarboxylase [bacterium]